MLPVLFGMLLCHLFTGGNCSFDSHDVIHKDNTFLQTAHGVAKAKGEQSCWVCGLMPASSQVYPYLAVPFTIPEYVAAYKHDVIRGNPRSGSVAAPQVSYYTVPMDAGPPIKIKLSYAPKGVICWTNEGKGRDVGKSVCSYSAIVGQKQVSISEKNLSVNVPLPPVTRVPGDSPGQTIATDALPAVNGTMFVCGQDAYSYLPPNWSGSCYVAYIVPALEIVSEEHLKSNATIRSKRAVATPTQRVFAAIIPNYGITVALDEIRDLVHIIDAIANASGHGLTDLNHELYGLRTMIFQHQYLLDFLAVHLGGYCFFIKRHLHQRCCTYVPDASANVSNYVHDIYDNVARLKSETAGWSLGGWLSGLGGSMFSQIVQILQPFVLPVIMLYVVVKIALCVFHRMTAPRPTPPGTAPILLAPLRVAVLESPPHRKVWCPRLRNVSKARPSTEAINFV